MRSGALQANGGRSKSQFGKTESPRLRDHNSRSNLEWSRQVSRMADGMIVGSAIVKRIASHQQDPGMSAMSLSSSDH